MTGARLLHAPQAWVDGRWQADVLMEVASDGTWAAVTLGVATPLTTGIRDEAERFGASPSTSSGRTVDGTCAVPLELSSSKPYPPLGLSLSKPQAAQQPPLPGDAYRLPGPVLPGLVNAHSHAFQRAFAGLAERREGTHDDFWSWRDRMYGVALRITPDELQAVATTLYREMRAGGYTHVCEFHYLHHAPDGAPYPERCAMARALAQAAQQAGIGLTLLPVLYERAGFTQPQLRADQRRFATTVDEVISMRDEIRSWRMSGVDAGVAVHSLRAARGESIAALAQRCADDPGPVHVHIAEQTGEVEDCLSATGRRPIEWLCANVPLDARWHLVHATHATPQEIEAVARSGAGVVVCPTTEANLGDGLFDLPRWLAAGVPLSIGSDSHVSRHWPRELQLLEYGQRLVQRRRNVAASPESGEPSTAERLFQAMLLGGAAAACQTRAGLIPGARADAVILDCTVDALAGVPLDGLLDALVFATDVPAFAQTWVGGVTDR
jgi:formimidoylglutamate deiminase